MSTSNLGSPIYCRKCGTQNLSDSNYCRTCAAPLATHVPVSQLDHSSQERSDRLPTMLAIIAVLSPVLYPVLGCLAIVAFVNLIIPSGRPEFALTGLFLIALGFFGVYRLLGIRKNSTTQQPSAGSVRRRFSSIEEAILQNNMIDEAAVIYIQGSGSRKAAKAIVTLKEGASTTVEDIINHYKTITNDDISLSQVSIVHQFPMNTSGKIDVDELYRREVNR